jgi:hypothetical protein
MTKDQRIIKICERCGCDFKCSPSQIKRGRRFCSNKCSHQKGIRNNTGRTLFKIGHLSPRKGKNFKTALYFQIRNNEKSKQWRSDVFKRDKWTCQTCGKRGVRLEAHHIKGFSEIIYSWSIQSLEQALLCPDLWDTINGVTLCYECHQRTKCFKNLKGGKSEMMTNQQ